MTDNLKQKAAKGILWKFFDQGGVQLIQFITGIYIARLLTKDDYGLIGMMAIFLGISQVFIDSGFKATLIQKGNQVTQDDYNSVFYFNTGVSLFFYLLIFFGAPTIARFYEEPRLTLVARIVGLNLVLLSLGMIQQIILEKRINFKTITKINLLATGISVSSGIVFAIVGLGVWALVSMVVLESFTRTLLLWIVNRWRPNFSFRFEAFKALFANGSKLLFSGIINQIGQNGFSLVIGKFFTTADVGLFSQAKKLQQRISDFIIYSIQGVLLPVQSLLKDDLARLKNSVRTNVKITTLIAFPAIVGLMAIAEPFVRLALTEKWIECVDYIYILSAAGFLFVLYGSIGSYIIPLGKINFYFRFIFLSNLFLIVVVIIGLVFQVPVKLLVVGKVLQELFSLGYIVYYSYIHIKYTLPEILKDAAFPIIISATMGISVYFIGLKMGTCYLSLFIQVMVGGCIYVLLNYLFNRKMFSEIQSQLRFFLKRDVE
jgi:O-antigen/teichoic acid export membrane protein